MDPARLRLAEYLRLSGPASKAELLRSAAVSRSTIPGHLKALAEVGLIVTTGASLSRGGRPSEVYALAGDRFVVSAQVRSGAVDVAICSLEGAILARESTTFSISDGPVLAADRIADLVGGLSGFCGAGELVAAGVGVAGPVSSKSGTVVAGSFFRNWEGIDFRSLLHRRLGIPVVIDNDANTAARGEHSRITGQVSTAYLYVHLGETLGCGVLVDGQVYRGAVGAAGEIGHVNAVRKGPRCGCGRHGCLGVYLGASRITDRAAGLAADGRSPGLAAVCAADGRIDLDGLAQAVRLGDFEACALVDDCVEKLATALANLVNVLNPDMVVLSGPVARMSDAFVNDVRAGIYAQTLPLAADQLIVEHSPHEPLDSALLGGALLAVDVYVRQVCS